MTLLSVYMVKIYENLAIQHTDKTAILLTQYEAPASASGFSRRGLSPRMSIRYRRTSKAITCANPIAAEVFNEEICNLLKRKIKSSVTGLQDLTINFGSRAQCLKFEGYVFEQEFHKNSPLPAHQWGQFVELMLKRRCTGRAMWTELNCRA
jgi:hypothetical protein